MARDLVCFSHLRWDFVYQRPNHLMARAARDRRVFFVEEPTFAGETLPHLTTTVREGLTVATPRLPAGLTAEATLVALRSLVDELFQTERIRRPVLWFYTPMSLPWSRHLPATATVYDSMDHLAGFRGASPDLLRLEAELVERADLVFCGGASLHERMRQRHPASYPLPSSVDVGHFAAARTGLADPTDQAPIPRPRIGFAGVIDERLDAALIDAVATARPDWQVILLGPVVKIADEDLPTRSNIHRLGMKDYAELPAYLGSWDVGWMPFAHNEATRYISPTKTPEYLAAGLPVVSTSIRDVVDPYGTQGLVSIADGVAASTAAIERALAGANAGQARVDAFLASRSWDRTWAAMAELVDGLQERADRVASRDRRELHAPFRASGTPAQPGAAAVSATAGSTVADPPVMAGRAGRAGRAG
ncbi:MAG TPA: glycosyltransferase [Patescibacteria group bacterium]|nr:glycosyltransferase [Patescibacteria group bacterium]